MIDVYDIDLVDFLARAIAARDAAYAPYSGYHVGACLIAEDGSMYTGCNIENASYSATICAERTALFKAVSEGARSIVALAVAADGALPYPCGVCRQALCEFADDDMPIWVTDGEVIEQTTLGELQPFAFRSANPEGER